MDILGKIFGNPDRAKLLRLFLNNPEDSFGEKSIVERSKIKPRILRKELTLLRSIDFIHDKIVVRKIEKRKRIVTTKQKEWQLNHKFPHNGALRILLSGTQMAGDEVLNWFKHAGRLKLVIISGLFIQESDCRVDILIVGDNLNKSLIERNLHTIEAEVGKELSYAVLPTEEFKYRLEIYDKFIRDILDFPHRTLLDKLGVE